MKNIVPLLSFLLIAGHFFQLNAQLTDTDPVINKPPAISISGPSNGTTFTAPASFSLNAIANDADGTIDKVEFYSGATLLGTTSTYPYSINWSNVPEGIYTVSAKATDNLGASTSSTPVTLIVTTILVNQLPTVTLTAPVNNSIANAPASITMGADAADVDGFISRVEFYNGTLLLGVDYTAPYSYIWTGVGAGSYRITAKAIDNQGGSKVSPAVVVTLLAVVTDVCSGLSTYIENGNYIAGSKVKNNNNRYECKPWPYSGWCNGAEWAYAPGTGAYWTDAWTLTGTCGNATGQSVESAVSTEISVSPNPVLTTANVHLVLKQSDQVSLQLYDKYSQYILTVIEGYFAAGAYDLPLNMQGFQRGTYMVRCISSTNSRVMRIEKAE